MMHNLKEMDSQKLPAPPVSLEDQPIQLSCLQAIPAASSFSLSPVILQPEQALSQTIYLKALTIPLYQPIQSEGLQPNSQLSSNQASFHQKNSHMPFILSPLVHSEGTDQLHAAPQKPFQTINMVGGLPVLPQNSSPCAPLGSPGKSPKSAGKYLCKHCGRDCLKPSVLEKHMRSHTGERPFPCTTCGIAFKTQSNLYKHRRTQTHVNNSRLPSESDSGSLLEESEKEAENIRSPQTTRTSERNCDYPRAAIKQAMSESTAVITSEKQPPSTSLPAVNTLSIASEGQGVTTDNSCHGGLNQNVLEKETMKDLATLLQRRKVQDQKSPGVSQHSQRQQATYPERLWDSKSPDYKLKKCESTDSGYLSRSDSVEQQMMSPSPLHSLCEHSTESDGDTTMSDLSCTSASHLKADPAEKATGSSVLEKKKLEEHIAKLISQNKAVVDDTQLDNVRPRKTVLSKQGSIDLPMPYTYKDSFHFDIRSLDTNRRKNLSLCSAKSTFMPFEKAKPLFFHSVPTQFSTTIDCVPVTRSNSLPFVESTRRIQDQGDSSLNPSFTRVTPNASVPGLSHSKRFVSGREDFPSSHPRALVRQVAVDDLPLGNIMEPSASSEEAKGAKKAGARVEGSTAKCKKSGQRKVKMFSQEKWQVYGNESFKKIYQKMKSKQKGNKVADISDFPLDTKEAASPERITGPRSGRGPSPKNLVSSPVAIPAQLNTEGSEGSSVAGRISQSASSQESLGSFSELMETSFSVSDGEPTGKPTTFVACTCRDLCAFQKELDGNNQILSLNTGCESKLQLCQAPDQEPNILPASLPGCGKASEEMGGQGEYIKHVPEHEDIPPIEGEDPGGNKSFPIAHEDLLPWGNGGRESQKLPSERKKLKVDEQKTKENTSDLSCGPSSPKDRIVKLLDQFKIINVVAPVSINSLVKAKTPKFTADTNSLSSSGECKEIVQYPAMSSNNRDSSADNTASVSAFSFSEQLRAEVTKEYICSSHSFHKLTENRGSMIIGTRMPSPKGDIVTASPSIQPLVTPHLKKNEFLPKYILKYPQEGNRDMSLLPPGGLDQKTLISLPMTSTDKLPHNYKSLGTTSTEVCVCPLQLGLNQVTRTKELKWDSHPTRKSLVACSPAILETTSITTRVDGRCHQHQSAWQKKVERAEDRDNTGEEQEGEGDTMVCSAYVTGKKICFTSMYTGGFFITSDMTGRNPALKLIHSGNSSVISVSSMVERAALCGNHDNKIKEWEPGINSFSKSPTSSGDSSRCLCHSSDMLYCHMVCTPQKEVHTLSQLSRISHAGSSKSRDLSVSFPTLNAEPRLTWCCLTRNLPLPVEQKEKKDSVYSSLHTSKKEKVSSKGSLTFCKMKHTKQAANEGSTSGTANSPMAFCTQGQQMQKPYFSAAGGDELLKSIPEQEKTNKTLCKIRELTSISKAKRSRKWKKVKINPKRYKGSYGHRPLRLSKQQWPVTRAPESPKKHPHLHVPDGRKHRGKCLCLLEASQGRDQSLQPCTSSSTMGEAASFVEKHPMKEGTSDSGTRFSSLGSSSNCEQEDPENGQVASRPGGLLPFQRTATAPVTHTGTLHTHVLAPKDGGLAACPLGKLLKDLQPEMHPEYPCTSTGTYRFEFRDPSKSHPCDRLCPEGARSVSEGLKAEGKSVLCMESRTRNVSISEPLPHDPGRAEASSYSTLHKELPPTIQTPCYPSLRSKLLTETTVPNICSTGSRYVQEATRAPLHLGCADKNRSTPQLDNRPGTLCAAQSPAFRNPSAPLGSPGRPPKSYKKQTLEMMNKQTHVEEDTSSEDEDRLVIEI
ncbi:zinc finger protein 831 [Paroedura picta]|uniref:zinc finger protein 831 n=1 Tax=Paroedura picta TaxID=143630 RepID=UPI004056D16F